MSSRSAVRDRVATTVVAATMVWALLCAATNATATVVVPPRNLGELAAVSQATVVAVAGRSWVETRGETLVTRTRVVVEKNVSGSLSPGNEVILTVPGGELEGTGWLVPGAPSFVDGGTYLLFLERADGDAWRPRMLAYGVLEGVRGASGEMLLAPVAEAGDLVVWQRPDGEAAEKTATYNEERLVGLLRRVARGEARWDAEEAVAAPDELPLRSRAEGTGYGCPMIGSDSGNGVRWDKFDDGKTVSVYSESRGEPEFGDDGGHRQVKEALETWMGVAGTSLKFSYAGKKSYSLSCGSGFDAPSYKVNIVVFNDPCGDLGAMDSCSGVAAYGGPWYKGTHTFNSRTWRTAIGLYVIVNDGAPCIGMDMYRKLIAHELGHGLGFSHSDDPSALMYAYCCNSLNDTDEACVRYVYPGHSPGGPPAPEGTSASDGTVVGAVTVTWNTAAGATKYEVWRSENGSLTSAQPLGEVATAAFTDAAAPPGVAYTYWVRGRGTNSLGAFGVPDSGYAGCAAASGPELVVPDAVISGEEYTVQWQEVSGAQSYRVEESETADFVGAITRSVAATSADFQHAVSAEVVFYYRVRAEVSCGAGEAPADYSRTEEVTVVPGGDGIGNALYVAYVAGIARATGAGGESWRTDLELRNRGDAGVAAAVELLRMNVANAAPITKAVTVEPGSTLTFQDVLGTLFSSSGAGVLRISCDSPDLIVSARTYNQTEEGSFGQFIPELDGKDILTGSRPGRLVQLAHATSRTRGRRTNIGIVNDTDGEVRVEVRLFSSAGQLLGTHAVDLGARGAVQLNDVFAGLTATDLIGAYAIVAPLSSTARIIAYASVIDNRTGDPEFVTAR